MSRNTPIQVRVDDTLHDGEQNRVRLELSQGSAVESIVVAYRHEGELFELAERKSPAAAELHGEIE